MAEFAAAALTSIGSTVAEGAAAIGTAATGPAGIFGLGQLLPSVSTAASILSGGATVLAVLNAQRAGEAKELALNAQADDAITQSRIEELQGIDRKTSLKAALVQQIGNRDVATAASGTDLSFGTAAIARRQDIADSERALSIDEETTNARIARLKERAANYRIQASQASAGGFGTAAALALDGGAKLLKRG